MRVRSLSFRVVCVGVHVWWLQGGSSSTLAAAKQAFLVRTGLLQRAAPRDTCFVARVSSPLPDELLTAVQVRGMEGLQRHAALQAAAVCDREGHLPLASTAASIHRQRASVVGMQPSCWRRGCT